MIKALRAFGAFWYEFVIGEDWKIAAAVATVLVVGAVAVALGAGGSSWFPVVLGLLFVAGFLLVFTIDLRSRRR